MVVVVVVLQVPPRVLLVVPHTWAVQVVGLLLQPVPVTLALVEVVYLGDQLVVLVDHVLLLPVQPV